MASKQIRDILDHIRSFHQHLHDFYEKSSEQVQDERVKVLLEYIGRHEENFNKAITQYEENAAEGLLDTWLQFAPDETLEEALQKVTLRPDMTPDDVIEVALNLDRKLIALYKELASSTSAQQVQELFNTLMRMEENKDHQYARSLFDV